MIPILPVLLLSAAAQPSLPALFPKEIPFPKDARIVQVMDQSRARAGSQNIVASYRTALDTKAILDLYRAFFRTQGRDLKDLASSGAPICSAQLNGYQCTVTVLESMRTVMVAVEPDGRTFAAFHEQNTSAPTPAGTLKVEPLDTSAWRLSGAAFPGNHEPGALLMRHSDGSLWGLGLGLVHPRDETDAHGKRYCDNENPPKNLVRLHEGVRFATAAPGGPLGAFFIIDQQGTLHSFGCDSGGRLGQGVGDSTHRWFEPVPILKNVRYVVAESANTAAITEANELYVWGSNLSGQVPGFPESFAKSPVKVLDQVAAVALARDAGYVVKTDGTLWGWGEAYENGFLDEGVLKTRKTPYRIMDNVRAVFTTDIGPVMVIKGDGSLWTWGANSLGQCGNGQKGAAAKPTRIAEQVVRVAMDCHRAALLKQDGTVWTWGWNWAAQCGFDTKEKNILRPRKLAEGAVDVAVTSGETYVLMRDGSLWGCGHNTDGVALQKTGTRQVGIVDTGIRVK